MLVYFTSQAILLVIYFATYASDDIFVTVISSMGCSLLILCVESVLVYLLVCPCLEKFKLRGRCHLCVARFLECLGFLAAFPILFTIIQNLDAQGQSFQKDSIPKSALLLYLYFGLLQPLLLQLITIALYYCWQMPQATFTICNFYWFGLNSWMSLRMAEAFYHAEGCYRAENSSFDLFLFPCICFSIIRNSFRLKYPRENNSDML